MTHPTPDTTTTAPASGSSVASSPAGSAASGAPSGAELRLEGIAKSFGDFHAVKPLDLTVPAGEYFALLGPTGCGNTTLLRMIAGLEDPTEGTISIGGREITGLPPYKRPVNTVFQSYALFPHMSIRDNVAFGLKRRKVKDWKKRAGEFLELVELSHLADRKPAQLSGGQQQRVALARALVNQPDILLLDEPLGALDMKLRRQMQSELKHIQTEVGLTFVHVTHDQEEAMSMADTVAVMNAGRIEQMGAPQELYNHPRTAFVANFLGRSNLMEATVTGRAGDMLTVDAGGQRLLMDPRSAVSVEGDVLLGVRPEKLDVFTAGADDVPAGDHLNRLRGRVADVAFTGVSTEYRVQVPGVGVLSVFAQNRGGHTLAEGEECELVWDPKHAFGLDGAQDAKAGEEDA